MSRRKIKAPVNKVTLKITAILDEEDNVVRIEGHHNAKTIMGFANAISEYLSGCISENIYNNWPQRSNGFQEMFEAINDFVDAFTEHTRAASEKKLSGKINAFTGSN